jgi:cell division protein FtsQ
MNAVGSTGAGARRAPPRPFAAPASASAPPEPARRGFLRRRGNRRITVSSPSVALWIARSLHGAAKRGLVALKALAAVVVLVGVAWGGEQAVQHVVASPRFAVQEIRVAASEHIRRDELLALAAVAPGDKLLSIDTDAVATRVASHPWVAAARVRRELPSMLVIDVSERRAVAAALLGGILYLIDENGRPFKRATMEEADGLLVLTGLSRPQYAAFRDASEAAYREALEIFDEYRSNDPPSSPSHPSPPPPSRPALSEIHIDPRYGFSLLLYDGGGEIRLGRAGLNALGTLGTHGPAALRTIHLDGPNRDRVAVKLAENPAP